MSNGFQGSFARVLAVAAKEFVQMRRDRLTFAIMVAIPVMQLLLFGYAINSDPRHMRTLVEAGDWGPASRAIVEAMETSNYFDIVGRVDGAEAANEALVSGQAGFVLSIPPDFERAYARGERPQILLDVDATDPIAAGGASGAFPRIVSEALSPETHRVEDQSPVEAIVHRRYNPAGRTAVNIVPGLLGTILTMTMAMMTSMAITREAERGTLETLLSTPTRPIEVMAGKIAPYIVVGVLQTGLMLVLALGLFNVPFLGDPLAFAAAVSLFVLVNLSLGFLFSTIARSQMQAMQMTFFVFLPSILLSGFMFPFAGMPGWAQVLGNALPTTHFIKAVREIMLKGAGLPDITGELWPLAALFVVIAALALSRYRRTLD
ncbi:ABC transporter permease [Oceanicaulis sp. LC35]|uniref:ABC transporter permease n=1 Tax=Oceanicaulis sp. LC35 TaxID=3349635 RepID=UPI003F83F054